MADFRINVIVDPSRVPQGTRVVERSLARVENRADRLRRTLGLTFGALAGGAIIFGAVRAMARFEESMATIRAVTKATSSEFEQLTSAAQELGITTRFSATQAADGMVLLARAGFSVQETLAAVGDTLNLAQAGGLGLAEAADITASVLRGFRIDAADAARVTDVLVETSNRANTNVSQLGQAMKFVAPVAKGLKQTLEGTSAAVGVLSDAGLKATLAGTGLRRVLAELESPGKELESVMARAGLTLDQVKPSVVGLEASLEALRATGIDTGEALDVFGQRGGPAFEVLVNNIPKIREMTTALKAAEDAAADMAKIMDQTLNGALFRARSAIEGFVLALGEAGTSDVLIGTLDALATAFRFLARNADTVTSAVLGLATALTVNLLARGVALVMPAMRTFAVTMVVFRGNVLAATAALIKMNAAALVNPFALLTIGVVAGVVALKTYIGELDKIGKLLDQMEEDAERIPHLFAASAQAQRELNKLQRQAQEQGFTSEGQLAQIKLLEERLGTLGTATKEQVDKEREMREARNASAVTVENVIARLDREAEALRNVGREAENRAAAEAEIQKLLQAGPVTGDERQAIRDRVARNAALKDQTDILSDIAGPQEEFRRKEAAILALIERFPARIEEFTAKLRELKEEFAGEIGGDPFKNSLDSLRESNDLLELQVKFGEDRANFQRLENQLIEEKVKINDGVRKQIVDQVLRGKQLNEILEDRAKLKKDAAKALADEERAALREERQLDRLEQRIKSQRALNVELARLQTLFDQGRLSADEFALAQENVKLKGLEASNALADGFERAFIKISQEANDLAKVGEAVVNVFADNATEALVKFAETGQFKFKEFANAILSDLIRIIARLLVVQAIQAATGLGSTGPAVGNITGITARADGGTVQPDRPFKVGERGEEVFVPNRTGTIIPNQAAQAQQQQPVNVNVTTVLDPNDIPNSIGGGDADEQIVVAISRMKERVNQVLS